MKWWIYAFVMVILASSASALTCGEHVIRDVKITSELICTNNGIFIDADDITIDCDNHAILGRSKSLSGIEAQGRKGIIIKNCGIRGFTRGIYFVDVVDSVITSNELKENENGIEIRDSELVAVRDNGVIVNNIGIGAYNSKDITIFNNLIRDNERGIVRYIFTNVSIIGNTLERNREDIYDFNEILPGEEKEEPTIAAPTGEEPEAEEEEKIVENPLTAEELLDETISLEYRLEEINEELLNQKLDELGKTSEDLEIKREIIREDGKTRVVLTIIPHKKFKSLDIYERIPKCFAAYIDLVVFEKPPEVLADDPLIKWHFEELDIPAEMIYSTTSLMPDECEDLFQAIGLGEIVKPQRWWYALVILVVVASIVIYFARFTKK
jgi:hypothetical protein